MNWYKIFYWVATADSIKGFFDTVSNLFLFFVIVSVPAWIFLTIYKVGVQSRSSSILEDNSEEYCVGELPGAIAMYKLVTRIMIVSCICCFVTWMCYIFVPTKKDALLIIAGGSVGSFITSDSSVRQIPSEITLLIRNKLRDEINDVKASTVNELKDTLAEKTKEQLIQMIKNSKK